MDQRPELSQLQEYVQILHWQDLAIALGCDPQKVDEIDKDNRKTVDARREMFKLYLKNPEATNVQVYDALRSSVVGEAHTAEKYRKLFVSDSVESLCKCLLSCFGVVFVSMSIIISLISIC